MRVDDTTPHGAVGFIFLDGVWQPACYGFDDVEGWVRRMVEAPDSRPHEGAFRGVIENGAYKMETVYGKVQFTGGAMTTDEVMASPGYISDIDESMRLVSQI